jgi:hypothetical protein
MDSSFGNGKLKFHLLQQNLLPPLGIINLEGQFARSRKYITLLINFSIKGVFFLLKTNNTPGLCIAKMHTAVQQREGRKKK